MKKRPEFGPVFGTSPRERLLEAAADLFTRDGINATGIDSVIKKAGTAKTTLYSAFGSKEGLILAVLEAESDAWFNWFLKAMSSVEGSAEDKLLATFDILARWFNHDQFYGCPLFNAMAEAPASCSKIRDIAFRHRLALEQHFEGLARDAGVKNAQCLVPELMIIVEGAIISASLGQGANAAKNAARTFAAIMQREAISICSHKRSESVKFANMTSD